MDDAVAMSRSERQAWLQRCLGRRLRRRADHESALGTTQRDRRFGAMTVEIRDVQPTFRVHDPDAGVYVVFMDGRQIGLVQKQETWRTA